MTLEQLYNEAQHTNDNGLGFVIKSLAHPERRFRVCFKFTSGKYGITRLDTGKDYIVEGNTDRYDFAISPSRVRDIHSEITELEDQRETINGRILELSEELEGLTVAV